MTTPPDLPDLPDATDLPQSSLVLGAPVTAVTVLEDRAEVERTVSLVSSALTPGVHRLRLGPVSPLVVDHSLRGELVGVPGGSVLDLRVVRRYTPKPPVTSSSSSDERSDVPDASDVSVVERRVKDLSQQLRRAELEVDRLAAHVAVLEQLLVDVNREIAESAGAGDAHPERWREALTRPEGEYDRHDDELGAARRRAARLKAELIEAQEALEASETAPMVLTADIEAVLEIPEGGAVQTDLTLRHLTPCTLWRPAYRATLATAFSAGEQPTLRLERDAFLWQRTGEPWTDVRVTLSTARPARAAEPPFLPSDVISLRDRSAEERRTVEVDLREVDIPELGPTLGETATLSTLPGVDDGGEARRLVIPTAVTVPSDGRAHRVPLGETASAATVDLVCLPELSPLVLRNVRFRNDSGVPLLSGPVDLVRDSAFVGRGELRFTAPDAPAELCLGSDDAFRAVRSVQESTETVGLSGRTVRSRTVRVALTRFAAEPGQEASGPLRVSLRERVPVSELAEVEVRLDKDGTSPQPDALDADGIARWELDVRPDERRTVVLRYDVVAARSVSMTD
ncbi:mucoidy inhibitor MuiA family protein [Streptacidiphilus fuscans]|uniref:Mucoidy inhibitor MuiA family protein n=1 Tax=Streptacidiphilus fuscans TaxID=2789292 RepID=A0A931FBJ6_9ACTN|nr:mucoidy inhibitor MuiA family protein [Streptacidiphilus fuscans]MBF9067518.1 mucoidy inhibitor MuiA family protein [Streptacidiphilus fuscans]